MGFELATRGVRTGQKRYENWNKRGLDLAKKRSLIPKMGKSGKSM